MSAKIAAAPKAGWSGEKAFSGFKREREREKMSGWRKGLTLGTKGRKIEAFLGFGLCVTTS